MYIDSQNRFSNAQAITATAASTDSIDLGSVRDIGTGEELYVVMACTVAMTDAGSDSTVAVSIEGDTTSGFGAATSAAMLTFPALSAAGTLRYFRLNPASPALQFRHIQLRYTVAGGNLTTGSFTSFLTNNIDRYVSYADAITIS